MKLELTKETNKKKETFLYIYVDGMLHQCFADEAKARAKFDELVKDGVPEETKEVLLSVEL